MIKGEDLLDCFVCYGRAPVQDFVTRSRNIQDTIQYLQMERGLEMFRLTSFVTKDLKSFEKRKINLWPRVEHSETGSWVGGSMLDEEEIGNRGECLHGVRSRKTERSIIDDHMPV